MTNTNHEDTTEAYETTCAMCGRDYESRIDPARIVAMNASPACPRCHRDGMMPFRTVRPNQGGKVR